MKPTNRKPFIEGETINLRPLLLSDVDGGYVDWFNDAEVCRFNSHHVYPYNRKLAAQFVSDAQAQKQTLLLAVVTKKGKHIGNISLQQIDYISRSAELALILGEKAYWGKGAGTEAARLMVRHGFEVLNLHRIYCGTSVHNIAMQKLAAGLRMRKEGRRREALYKNGGYADIIEYGLLKKDFSA